MKTDRIAVVLDIIALVLVAAASFIALRPQTVTGFVVPFVEKLLG